MNLNLLIDKISKEKKYSVLIDSGAFFRDSLDICLDILKVNLLKDNLYECIVYIDNDNIKKYMTKTNINTYDTKNYTDNIDIPLNKRFYYFDNKHIVGQDFKINENAYGLVTIRYDSKLRDISQGIFRLRKIELGQRCDIIYLSEDKHKIMDSHPNVNNEIIYYLLKKNDDDFLNNTKKIYIKQNLIGLLRLYYEQQKNSYGISEDTDKICMDYNKIFAYNIYLLPNLLLFNQDTYKININNYLYNILINIINKTKRDTIINDLEPLYDKFMQKITEKSRKEKINMIGTNKIISLMGSFISATVLNDNNTDDSTLSSNLMRETILIDRKYSS